jgi:glycerophosphoryl diester phosphodiesterase
MAGLDWLVSSPIAHRGLHDLELGVVENTPCAVARAVEHGFSVEIDIQATADGEAVVFHDPTLDRLTEMTGPVAALTLSQLRRVVFRETSDRFWTLDECLDLVGGRQPLIVEVKSSRRSDGGLGRRVAERLAQRTQPVALKSFDPRVLRAALAAAPNVPRGIIGEGFAGDRSRLTALQRFGARNLLHAPLTRPHFLSWNVHDLPSRIVSLARRRGLPVMTWTVRTPADQARAALFADQMVFEGFLPVQA